MTPSLLPGEMINVLNVVLVFNMTQEWQSKLFLKRVEITDHNSYFMRKVQKIWQIAGQANYHSRDLF